YTFGLKTEDSTPNSSGLSNVITQATSACPPPEQFLDSFIDDSSDAASPIVEHQMARIVSTQQYTGGVALTSTAVAVGGTVAAGDIDAVVVKWNGVEVGSGTVSGGGKTGTITLTGAGNGDGTLTYYISFNAGAALDETFSLTVTSVTGGTDNIGLPQTTALRTIIADQPPAAVGDLSVGTSYSRGITLTWTAPDAQDPITGNTVTSSYDFRYEFADDVVGNYTYNTALEAAKEPTPRAAGALESYILTCQKGADNETCLTSDNARINPNSLYHIAVQSSDATPLTSPTSNVVTAHSALKYGWNAASIPYALDGTTFASLFSELGTVYVYTLGAGDAWTQVTSSSAVSSIGAGKGFYIYSSKYTSVLDNGGALSENGASYVQVNFPNTGNNLVGNPYLKNVDWSLVKLCDGSTSTFDASAGCTGGGGEQGSSWDYFKDASGAGCAGGEWVDSTISYYANLTSLTDVTCNAGSCTPKMRSWWAYWVDRCAAAPAGTIMAVPKP
ncbi:MAG: hypothetical protein KAR06_09585, partial [Deltaproteobacteria bacterium]|nr:hypothetical protein [Deltaproteobacteria bacterium]